MTAAVILLCLLALALLFQKPRVLAALGVHRQLSLNAVGLTLLLLLLWMLLRVLQLLIVQA